MNKELAVNRLQAVKRFVKSLVFLQGFLYGLVLLLVAANSYAFDVVIIKSANIAPYNEAERGFRSEVSARIRTVLIDRPLEEEYLTLNKRLREHPADLLFVIGERALVLSKPFINKVPIVFSYVFDPEKTLGGDVSTLTSVAGVRMTIPPEKQILAFKEAMPSLKSIGIVYDPKKTQPLVERAHAEAKLHGIEVVSRPVVSPKGVVDAVESFKDEVGAILMLPDTTVINAATVRYLLLFSFRQKIPLFGLSEKHVKKGAFLGLAFENEAMGVQAGRLAMNMTKVGAAFDVVIEEPEALDLILNVKTVRKLNVQVRESFIEKVDVEYD